MHIQEAMAGLLLSLREWIKPHSLLFFEKGGNCDYLKLWILVGIPFGIRKMQIWIVPRNRDVGSTIAMLVFQMLIGGIIGGVVLVWKLFLLFVFMVLQLYKAIKKLIK